ncbi:MAG: HAD-IIB family hydrolase [Clostridia bacterium]|nr:HAD-IIB family hydrolase [Clostridia bacterium]
MGKFDGVLLMTDLDGTLFYKGDVSRENCEAIRYFQSEGGLFSVASGRAPDWLPRWRERFVPNTWSATYNGAILCDAEGKNFIFEHVSASDIVSVGMDVLRACPDAEQIYFCGDGTESYIVKQGETPDPARIPNKIYKCLLRVPSACSDAYTETVRQMLEPRYLVMRSWINGIEFQERGTGKGDALLRLKSLLGDRATVAVGVGNYENDLDLIRAADIGYAVGDAIQAVKAVADRITVDCADHAIAQIIAELEQERTLYC